MPPISDDRFEAYLDGVTPESERSELADRVRADEARLAEARLQERIDRALGDLFPPARSADVPRAPAAHPMRRRGAPAVARRAAIAAAAAVVVGAVLWQALPRGQRPTPYFTRAPLAQLYREAVAAGFEPYYECREPQRFAATFATRQGVPLQLLPMPEGARMLGLSYPGGLSRDTTAMLCLVDNEPVMVFVDRASADANVELATRVDERHGLHVFRAQRAGLVFYEVTPFAAPRVMDRMAVAKAVSSSQ